VEYNVCFHPKRDVIQFVTLAVEAVDRKLVNSYFIGVFMGKYRAATSFPQGFNTDDTDVF
jgi:hypothetical protein